MKLTKKQKEKISEALWWVIVAVIVITIFGGAYLIAVSDLPDWFKFWLLK